MRVTLNSLIEVLRRLPGEAVVNVVTPPGSHAMSRDEQLDVGVDQVTLDSRAVAAGSLFACVPGEFVDGHDFARNAVDSGAVALLVERELDASIVGTATQIVVDNTRERLGPVADAVAGHPSRALTTVGITGTNGKTTTSLMLSAIFEAAGQRTGIIGTLNGPRTTPEAPDLQQTLAGFVAAGDAAAVLEVSSHALALHRVDGTKFAAVVFTNFGRDHLDLHGTPEEYFRAKALLFTPAFAPFGVINIDDTHGQLLADTAGMSDGFQVVAYSAAELDDVVVGPASLAYTWRGHRIDVPIGGSFNVANSLAAVVTATELGIGIDAVIAGLAAMETVPGRFETVQIPGASIDFSVVVDYAHTPDGLEEVISSARQVIGPDANVIVVFGCGGDRDHAKRAEMGAVAAAGADRVVVTSDNPRTEDPMRIIDDVLEGVDSNYRRSVTSNPDRREAIGEALSVARAGDIVIIAGKGHEQTQDLGDHVVEFDDREAARSFLTAVAAENGTDLS